MKGVLLDLHAHVLPGLDDGPRNMEESLALLRRLRSQGVTTVVASAHAYDGRFNAARDAILAAHEQTVRAAEAAGIDLRILSSMEVYLGFDALQAARTGNLLGIGGGSYLIVELPMREVPLYTERAFFELMLAGYRPLLNHPERNLEIQRRPETFLRLAERGVGGMVTAASVLGGFGTEAQRLARLFLQEGAAAMVVSDAHDTVRRPPLLAEALAAAREYGKEDQAPEQRVLATIQGATWTRST